MKIYWLICFISVSFFACIGQSGTIFNKLKNNTISLVGKVKSGLYEIRCNAHEIGNDMFGHEHLIKPCPEDNQHNGITGNNNEDQRKTTSPPFSQTVNIEDSSKDFNKSKTQKIFFEINSKPISIDKGSVRN